MNDDNTVGPVYINRSKIFYRINAGIFLYAILMSFAIRPYLPVDSEIADLLIGLPVFALFVLIPMGMYYSWKSYKKKEGTPVIRSRYFFGSLLFSALLIFIIVQLVKDILHFF